MLEGGLKKKKRQDKGLVDEISAVIILQAYLEVKISVITYDFTRIFIWSARTKKRG